MKKCPISETDADALWKSFSRTGRIGAYLMYRAIRQHEEKKDG